jgi:hypothetical protein
MSKKRFKILTKKMGKAKAVVFGVLSVVSLLIFIVNLVFHLTVFQNLLFVSDPSINLYFVQLDSDALRAQFAGFVLYSFYALIIEAVLFFFLVFLFFSSLKENKKHREVLVLKDLHAGKTTTDLDNLYEILKQKKHLSVPMISKAFKVSEDIVLEWGKILEEGNLAKITYPRMSDPELVFQEVIKSKEGKNE